MEAVLDAVRAAFHRPATRTYRIVQGVVWTLIAGSVGLLLLELTLPEGSEPPWLEPLDRTVLGIFVVEIALRILSFHPPSLDLFRRTPGGRLRAHVLGRARYALRPLMLFDILAVSSLAPGLRGLRALRLLRLARTPRVFRYSSPFQGLQRAFQDNKLLFAFAFSVFGVSVLLGGLSIYLLEVKENPGVNNLGDGLWWAIVTLTTVGFGDITPESVAGKVVGAVLMVAGMFNLALFAGIVGNTLLHAVLSIREEQFRMSGILDHLVICGYDPGARLLLDAILAEVDVERTPVVLFAEGERPGDLPPSLMWVQGDPTKESELDKVRLTHAGSVIVVGARDTSPQAADAHTILTVFTLRSQLAKKAKTSAARQRPVYIVAEILDAENVDHARTAGADEVIETTRLGFSLLAHSVTTPGSGAVMSRVVSAGAHSLFVGRWPEEVGDPASFADLARWLKEERRGLLLGIRDPASDLDRLNPPDDLPVTRDMLAIYLAEKPVLEPI
jgi:voltage-gated potassium channel